MANTSSVLGLAKRIPISSIPFDRYEKDFMRTCGCFMPISRILCRCAAGFPGNMPMIPTGAFGHGDADFSREDANEL
ncbi:MAG: hypothetical protein C6W57_15120 [Caldibacillus debilis]|nr:MAG: hypothetical protein C6W57_15120 [Caldibacillus debilis]